MMPAEFFGNFVGMGAASENRRPRGTGCGERIRFGQGLRDDPGGILPVRFGDGFPGAAGLRLVFVTHALDRDDAPLADLLAELADMHVDRTVPATSEPQIRA